MSTQRPGNPGFVIISEQPDPDDPTKVHVYFVTGERLWTRVSAGARVFYSWLHASRHMREQFQGGRALLIPGGRPRVLSAKTAGVELSIP